MGRDYSQLCLDHDIMLLGPGEFGPYDPQIYQKPIEEQVSSKESIGYVRRFCSDVRPGDIALLRYGHRVKGIGIVDGDYEYDSTFDDVDGWDLQHTRRVIWQNHLENDLEDLQVRQAIFGHMKQQPTFSAVHDNNVRDRIASLLPRCQTRPLRDMSDSPPEPLGLATAT